MTNDLEHTERLKPELHACVWFSLPLFFFCFRVTSFSCIFQWIQPGSVLLVELSDLRCSAAMRCWKCKLLHVCWGGDGWGSGEWGGGRVAWHGKVTSNPGIKGATSIPRFLCLWASYSNPSDQDILFYQSLQAGQQINTSALGNLDNQMWNMVGGGEDVWHIETFPSCLTRLLILLISLTMSLEKEKTRGKLHWPLIHILIRSARSWTIAARADKLFILGI